MRDILFRGKDGNGVWRTGFYCNLNDGESYRIYTGYAETDIIPTAMRLILILLVKQ